MAYGYERLPTCEDILRTYREPTPEMIPELVLLGELHIEEVALPDGRVLEVHAIHFENKKYTMKSREKEPWFQRG